MIWVKDVNHPEGKGRRPAVVVLADHETLIVAVAGTSQTWDEARPLIHVVERGTRWAVSMGLDLTTAFFSDDLRRLEPDDYVFLGRRAPTKLLEILEAALNDDGDA